MLRNNKVFNFFTYYPADLLIYFYNNPKKTPSDAKRDLQIEYSYIMKLLKDSEQIKIITRFKDGKKCQIKFTQYGKKLIKSLSKFKEACAGEENG